jgi:hypothetical protein
MSDTPKIYLVKTEKTGPSIGTDADANANVNASANAHLSEADYLKLASESVTRAGENGPLSVDPDVAEDMGAFWEAGLSDQDALDSHFDGLDPTADDDPNGDNDPGGNGALDGGRGK